jgi:hypothetical protein
LLRQTMGRRLAYAPADHALLTPEQVPPRKVPVQHHRRCRQANPIGQLHASHSARIQHQCRNLSGHQGQVALLGQHALDRGLEQLAVGLMRGPWTALPLLRFSMR